MAQRKRERSRRQGRAVALADLRDRTGSLDELLRRVSVVVLRAGLRDRAREQSAVEDARRDDADAALLAGRQQLAERRLLEQGVTAGDHEDVHLRLEREARERLDGVH